MNSQFLLSILIPCYNAAETLPEALESLSRQTFTDFEIVAVDDGSSDATPGILAEWERREPRLRLISQAQRGIVEALNAGLGACQGELIARMDADDRCHPERLGRQVDFLLAHPEIAVLGCRVAAFPETEVREGFRLYLEWQNALLNEADIRREMFVESPLAHPSVVFRKEWVAAVGGYQEHGWAEDYDLWLRLYLAGAHFAKLPEVLLQWRERPERLTRTHSRYSLENFLRAKAHYLLPGPLAGREAVLVWGAGMLGRRLSKHLLREGAPLVAFIDIDPRKIGQTRRGRPILPPEALPEWWRRYQNPALLAAVGARGARALIRHRLTEMGFEEGKDWWGAA